MEVELPALQEVLQLLQLTHNLVQIVQTVMVKLVCIHLSCPTIVRIECVMSGQKLSEITV